MQNGNAINRNLLYTSAVNPTLCESPLFKAIMNPHYPFNISTQYIFISSSFPAQQAFPLMSVHSCGRVGRMLGESVHEFRQPKLNVEPHLAHHLRKVIHGMHI
jgi:hypothetical protein